MEKKQCGERNCTREEQWMQDEETIDLAELMYFILAKWKLILASGLIAALLAGLYTFFLVTPMYEASSRIYVLPQDGDGISMSDLQIGAALTQDYLEVFNIWTVREEVIQHLGLSYTNKEIQKMVKVDNPSNTRMLDIFVQSPSPQEAAQIADEYARVASAFIAENMIAAEPRIMYQAMIPKEPINLNKFRTIMLGFMLGGITSAGFAVMQFLMDNKYKTPEDIRRYAGLANLAIIPVENETGKKSKKHTGRNRRHA